MKTRKNIIYALFIFVNITPYLYLFYDFEKIHFGIDGVIGFYPIYGFLACMGLIIIAKTFSIIFKKDDTYYD
jgi:hypothetical protein